MKELNLMKSSIWHTAIGVKNMSSLLDVRVHIMEHYPFMKMKSVKKGLSSGQDGIGEIVKGEENECK